jgi:hypothetical protein
VTVPVPVSGEDQPDSPLAVRMRADGYPPDIVQLYADFGKPETPEQQACSHGVVDQMTEWTGLTRCIHCRQVGRVYDPELEAAYDRDDPGDANDY